jgi:hypothetical protein
MAQKKIRIYTCQKHPHWTLESSAPVLDANLKQFCPLCRDEFWVKAIGVADCRVEFREVQPSAQQAERGG